jgi:hypothetical protein
MERGLQSAFIQLIKPASSQGTSVFCFVAAVLNRHANQQRKAPLLFASQMK